MSVQGDHDAMAMTIEQRLLRWPAAKKVALAEKLLASVESFANREIEQAWGEEIGRRLEEMETGRAIGVPAKEVHAKTRQILRDTRRLSQARRKRTGL